MAEVLVPLAFVIIIGLIGTITASTLLSIKNDRPAIIDQPKPRKEWWEERLERVWNDSMVAVYEWKGKMFHISMSTEYNLSNLRKYMCDIKTAIERMEREYVSAGDHVPEYDQYGTQYNYVEWNAKLNIWREFIREQISSTKTLQYRVQTAIDLELDKQDRKIDNTQQLALDF